jgi:tetratricopeptide (TPR) repeat protein
MVRAAGLRAAIAKRDNTAVWSSIATVSGYVGRLSRSPARWETRRGFALQRAGRLDAAARAYEAATRAPDAGPGEWAAFAEALERQQQWHEAARTFRTAWLEGKDPAWLAGEARCLGRAGDWRAVIDVCHRALKQHPEAPVWHERLARAQLHLRDLDGAVESYEAAITSDRQRAAPLIGLGDVHRARGDLLEAEATYRRVGELGAEHRAAGRLALADLYQACGRWGEAVELLAANVRAAPDDATSGQRFAAAVLELCRWGGSFVGPLDRPTGFRPQARTHAPGAVTPPADLVRRGRQAVARAVARHPERASWAVTLAGLEELAGDPRTAVDHYAEAVRRAEVSLGRWSWLAKHPWQFRLHRARHEAGDPAGQDPLFECAAEPVFDEPPGDEPPVDDVAGAVRDEGDPPGSAALQAQGIFDLRFTANGAKLEGWLASDHGDHVEIHLDDILLRRLNVSHDPALRRFVLPLLRETIAMLPDSGLLSVRAADGGLLLAPGGARALRLRVPHGDGSLPGALRAGSTLDKKGDLSASPDETARRQQDYLELYDEVRDFFERQLGRDLFVIYGTLLGIHRDGDLIPGDDDFDAGYLSEADDPEGAKAEATRLIVALVRGGYTVAFNRRGRLFRIMRDGRDGGRLHLDLRPLWFDGGQVWLHNYSTFPAALEDFLPVEEVELRGVRVSQPRHPEVFLEGHYGPGWRVPDPGFMYYREDIDPSIHAYLDRALLTPAEYSSLQRRVEAATAGEPRAGRLVAIGAQDLYPLEAMIW